MSDVALGPRRKQAVLVIHGIGNQRPMETLASFVEQIWRQGDDDPAAEKRRRTWYRPDCRDGNFDLYQVVAYDGDVRTDFYELYWAHLMEGTRFASVWAWVWRDLVRRRRADMEPGMQEARDLIVPILLAFATVFWSAVVTLLLFAASNLPLWPGNRPWPGSVGLGAGLFVLLCLGLFVFVDRRFISPFVGDAARYLRNTPENIAARQAIRALGVGALDALHERGYERVVVVGHSLGSIIGYDILRYSFGRRMREANIPLGSVPDEVSRFDEASGSHDTRAIQLAQRRLLAAFPRFAPSTSWLVTDFVTLGSPLAYASVLLASSIDGFDGFNDRKHRRLLPTNPPHRSDEPNEAGVRGFFRWRDRRGHEAFLTPHHGGMFAFTRWTNLYFPVRHTLWGDVIGGPVANLFGHGVRDVPLPNCPHLRARGMFRPLGSGLFSHTSYWTAEDPECVVGYIRAIRDALDFDDRDGEIYLEPSCPAPGILEERPGASARDAPPS